MILGKDDIKDDPLLTRIINRINLLMHPRSDLLQKARKRRRDALQRHAIDIQDGVNIFR